MYICQVCSGEKSKDEMAVDSTKSSGLRNYCKECHNAKEALRRKNPDRKKKNKEWVKANPAKIKQYRLNKYNITSELYDKLLEAQKGLCKICSTLLSDNSRTSRPCVDHDHKCCAGQKSCGKCVRGIICDDCNTALGKFKDNINILRKAINYLEDGYVETR